MGNLGCGYSPWVAVNGIKIVGSPDEENLTAVSGVYDDWEEWNSVIGWETNSGISVTCAGAVMTDSNIKTAVAAWLADASAAEPTYGHISTWDTSGVTDMFVVVF
jgi:hypothetical protein